MSNTNPEPSIEQILFLISRIVNELASQPEKTKITAEKIGLATTGIEINPWPPDYGKILGKDTNLLRAMMMICKLISDRTGKSIELTMKRIPAGVEQARLPEFKPNDQWRKSNIQALTEDIFSMIMPGDYRVFVTDGKQAKTAIDVVIGDSISATTADWIRVKLGQLYKSIGLKNGRIISFNLIQDQEKLNELAPARFTPEQLARLSRQKPE